MCNHRYIVDYNRAPKGIGTRCPYPDLFEKLRSSTRGASQAGSDLTLPHDNGGACIFHSRDIEWKRRHGFGDRFVELMGLLATYAEAAWYDFAEFLFVDDGLPIETERGQPAFRIQGRTFAKPAYFTGALFLAPVELVEVHFPGAVYFNQATFAHGFWVEKSTFRGLDFTRSTAEQGATFSGVKFLSFALFSHSRFRGEAKGYVVKFEESQFEGITDFSSVVFEPGNDGSVGFVQVGFEDFVDFSEAKFRCHTCFDRVSFASVVEFIDTSFDTVGSAARYRGAAVEFSRIELKSGASLTFKGRDRLSEMFAHDVEMSFEGEPSGVIRFDNVNLGKFTPNSRDLLRRLEVLGGVIFGPGCIKYRHQTEHRSVPVSEANVSLVLELCQTFANYFTGHSGLNLGFEVVDRASDRVTFFYFTDENISRADFLERLRQAETGLWNLLAVRSTGQLLALEASAGMKPSAHSERAVINAIDGISALIGTFFRVGARIVLGNWRESDTAALLGAIRFNPEGAEERTRDLHQVIVEKYTGKALLGINTRQNAPLRLLLGAPPERLSARRERILFLGVNSLGSPMALGREVSKIKSNLKLAKERDNLELRQEWAVTVDSLLQAMIDEAPSIVHFSGHGRKAGILLEDEQGQPKLVGADALASLFNRFKDTVRCVVLNSCYSSRQAQAIRRHIPHVVGMSSALQDSAAIAFSTGFYKAIGAGEDIPSAHELGIVAMRMEGVSAADFPLLL